MPDTVLTALNLARELDDAILHLRLNEVEIGVLFTERSRRIAARTVVLVSFNEPNRELAEDLARDGYSPHLIGDVRGRNSIMTAIHAAADLARSI